MEQKQIGHFEIIRELGRGGKGVVYLARDTRLDRLVALKFLKTEGVDRQKILHEAQLASRIRHPGVVTIYDVVDSPEGMFIVMEYVEGESLESFLRTHRIDTAFALRLSQELTRILAAAHRKGLVHGDLKPANIILTPEGNIKLLDFGLASLISGSSNTSGTSGTFPYIAPEQILGSPPTEQTDIYALGMILYRLFTGKDLFRKNNPAAVIYAIMNETPDPPSQLNKKIPPELDEIILRCLHKDAQKRYTSANVLLENLNSVILSESAEYFPYRRLYVGLAAALLILLVALFLFIRYEMKSAPQPITNLSSVELEEPTELIIHSTLPEKTAADARIRMFGLVELLKFQLQKIRNLAVQEATLAPKVSSSGITQQFHLLISIQEHNLHHSISFSLNNPQMEEIISAQYPFQQFDDLIWISSKIIEKIISSLSDKHIILNYESKNLKELITIYKHLAYGNFYYREKKYELALAQFDQALKLDPFLSTAHFYKGTIYSELKDYSKAIYEFNQALPEAVNKKLVDWEVEFPGLEKRKVRLKKADPLDPSSEGNDLLWFYSPVEHRIYLIHPNTQEIHPVDLSGKLSTFVPTHLYLFRHYYIVIAKTLTTHQGHPYSISLLDARTSQLLSMITLPGHPQSLPPNIFFYLDKLHQQIYHITANGELRLATMPLPQPRNCMHFPSSRPGYYLCLGDTNLFTIDISKKITENVLSLRKYEKLLRGYKTVLGDILIYHPQGTSTLLLYNFVTKEVVEELPLIDNQKNFQFVNRRPFFISWRDNELYVIQQDSFLHLYKIHHERQVNEFGRIALPPRATMLNRVSFSFASGFSIVFRDILNNEFLIFNKQSHQITRLPFKEDNIRYAFSLNNLIFVQWNNMLIVQDIRNGKTLTRLQGNFFPIHTLTDKKDVLFYEKNEGRLALFSNSRRRFQGFLQLESGADFLVVHNHLFYLTQNQLKSLNLELLPERDIQRLTNIYYQIAKNAYLAGNYSLASIESRKILQELNPGHLPAHIIQFNLSLQENNENQFARLLPRVYSLLPDNDGRKHQIYSALWQSGLYLWKQNVPSGQGKRLFQQMGEHLLFANIKPTSTGELWDIHSETGRIAWRYPYRYRFFGTLFTPGTFLYAEATSPQHPRNYYVLNLRTRTVQDSIVGTIFHTLIPMFYPVDSHRAIAFYQRTPKNPADILLLDVKEKSMHSLFQTGHLVSQPYCTRKKILFFSGDTLFTLAIDGGAIQKQVTPQPLPNPVKQILFNDGGAQTVFELTNGNTYFWDREAGTFRFVAKLQCTISPGGFIDRSREAHFLRKGTLEHYSLPYLGEARRAFLQHDTLFVLEANRIVLYRGEHLVHQVPLIWSGLDFQIRNGKAYVLNADGRIFAVRLNWLFRNVKKHLILSLN